MSHYHLKYFELGGTVATNYSASFLSEIVAMQAAALANSWRAGETGYYGIQQCRRFACRPAAVNHDCKRRRAAAREQRTRASPGSRVLN